MKEQITWPEYVKDHIEHVMWRGGQIDKTVAGVMDEVTVWVMEDEKLPDMLWAVTGKDSHDVGVWIQELVEKNLSRYCEQMADELKERFPEEWQDYKDENGIADNQYPCGKHTGDEQ